MKCHACAARTSVLLNSTYASPLALLVSLFSSVARLAAACLRRLPAWSAGGRTTNDNDIAKLLRGIPDSEYLPRL
jgi:hypothetical protein